MKVGDLVKHFLTEQIGIVIDSACCPSSGIMFQVLWTTQGISLFGPGSSEWCGESGLEALNESR
jgi:hypothetical protein